MKHSKKSNKKVIPQVTDSEWDVLCVLWNRGPVSASQVQTTLKPKTGWSLGAVRTFLARLVDKGAVHILDDEPINRYEAVFDRETMLGSESRTFLDKYFDGTFHTLVAHYLKNEDVPAQEIEQLKKLLNEHEK